MATEQTRIVNPHEQAGAAGWAGLVGCLSSLGVRITAAALDSLRRRHGLNWYCGGGAQGRTAWFNRDHLRAWFEFLTGVSLEIAEAGVWEAFQNGEPLPTWPRVRRTRQGTEQARVPRRPLYVILKTNLSDGTERVLRDPTGHMYATHDFWDAEAWSYAGDEFDLCRWWHFMHMRPATAADLHVPGPRSFTRANRKSTTLIGALYMDRSQLRWCRAPGPLFDLAGKVATTFLGPKRHPRFADARDWVNQRYPKAIWFAWTGRERILPVTMERTQPDAEEELIAIHRDLDL